MIMSIREGLLSDYTTSSLFCNALWSLKIAKTLKGCETSKCTLPPNFFSAEMKLWNIHMKNLLILSVSGILKVFKNWQKVAEICYQLVHDRVSRGLALFLIWRHRLIYMALTLCKHACKTVCDVKSGIDPCPSPGRSYDKAYQISGCTVTRKKFRCCEKMLSRFWNSFKFAFLRK